jgi:hypothetical protein
MSVILGMGLVLETFVHMIMNPVAEDRKYYKGRKLAFLGTICLSLFITMFTMVYLYSPELLWTIITITVVFLAMIITFKCNASKGSDVQTFHQTHDKKEYVEKKKD